MQLEGWRDWRSMCMQGVKATRDKPNAYLYQALALMATELGYTEEARQWFTEGTKTLMVRCAWTPRLLFQCCDSTLL